MVPAAVTTFNTRPKYGFPVFFIVGVITARNEMNVQSPVFFSRFKSCVFVNFSTLRGPFVHDDANDPVMTDATARPIMKKKPTTPEPLRESISVNFSRRHAAAFRRLGNRFGSRSAQVHECIDWEKVEAKVALADAIAAGQPLQN